MDNLFTFTNVENIVVLGIKILPKILPETVLGEQIQNVEIGNYLTYRIVREF